MSLSMGYVTPRQARLWDLRKKGMAEAAIAKELEVSRQTVHKAVTVANRRIERALLEIATLNRIETTKVILSKGILIGYSIEFNTEVMITYSRSNGIQIWYEHDVECRNCDEIERCSSVLLREMKDRNIELPEGRQSLIPSKLAKVLFSTIRETLK